MPATPRIQRIAPILRDAREECAECSASLPIGTGYRRHNRFGYFCETCFDASHSICTGCNDTFDNDDMAQGQCERCNDDDDEDHDEDDDSEAGGSYRDYNTQKLPEFMSTDTGATITSPRIFSAELECYYHDGDEARAALKEIPRAYGVSSDGSLNYRGLEIQTPMLQGKKGEESLIATCATLNTHGFTTDRSTGLHIHLDGEGLIPKTRTKGKPYALAQAFMFYIAFEDVLLSFLPHSRRANTYCRGLRNDYHAKEIADAKTLEALEKIWYRAKKRDDLVRAKAGKYHDTRYFGLNLHSLLKDGHVEIRFHSGTLNATKILEWTNLHQTILDKCLGTRRQVENFNFGYHLTAIEMGIMEPPKRMPTKKVWQDIPSELGTKAMQASTLTKLSERTERMFELLELPPRARAYFKSRQRAFSNTGSDNDEEVCAA